MKSCSFLAMMRMNIKSIYIFAAVLAVFGYTLGMAQDIRTHNVYKVTSYNLGAILDMQNTPKKRFSTDFNPLLITNSASDIFNNEHEGTVSWVETDSHTVNTRGVAVAAQFNATRNFAVLGAFGVTRNLWAPDSINYENESSWEANLGMIYNLLGNLSYEIHFAYMDTGDLFTERSSYSDVESIIMVSNRLTMSF